MKKVTLDVSFKDHLEKYILKHELFKPKHNSIYTLDRILGAIECILKTGASWRSFDLSVFGDIKWQSIRYHFDKFRKAKVFENVYKQLLEDYFKTNKSGKLKYLSVDASFVRNKCASDVGYNGFYKKKKWAKISLIVDSFGVPISALMVPGNMADSTIFHKNMQNLMVEIKSNTNNNKHKRYMLADAAYDNNNVRDKINTNNITPIIWHVKRKRKNPEENKKFNKRELKIYNKRIIVENCFSWIYQNERLTKRIDKSTSSYYAFMYMAFMKILLRRM